MFKKDMKALLRINAFMDDEMKKLYDTLKSRKCCINRQERLLMRWKDYFTNGSIDVYDNDLLKLLADTQKELSYPLFRKKMKGGKNA